MALQHLRSRLHHDDTIHILTIASSACLARAWWASSLKAQNWHREQIRETNLLTPWFWVYVERLYNAKNGKQLSTQVFNQVPCQACFHFRWARDDKEKLRTDSIHASLAPCLVLSGPPPLATVYACADSTKCPLRWQTQQVPGNNAQGTTIHDDFWLGYLYKYPYKYPSLMPGTQFLRQLLAQVLVALRSSKRSKYIIISFKNSDCNKYPGQKLP